MFKKHCLLQAIAIAMLYASGASAAANTMSSEKLGDIQGRIHELLKKDTEENDKKIAELVGQIQRASFTKGSLKRKADTLVNATRQKLDTRAKKRGTPTPAPVVEERPEEPARPTPSIRVPSTGPRGGTAVLPTPTRREMAEELKRREAKKEAAAKEETAAPVRPAEGPAAAEVTEAEVERAAEAGAGKREVALNNALVARLRAARNDAAADTYNDEYQRAPEGAYPAFRVKVEKVVAFMRNPAANQAAVTTLIGEIRTDGYANTADALNTWLTEAIGGVPAAPAEGPAAEEAAEEPAAEAPVIRGVGTPHPDTWGTSAGRLSADEIRAELDWLAGQSAERPLSDEEDERKTALERAAKRAAAEEPAAEAPAGGAEEISTMPIEDMSEAQRKAELARLNAKASLTFAEGLRKSALQKLVKAGAGEAAKKEAAAPSRLEILEKKEAEGTLSPMERAELTILRRRGAIETESVAGEEAEEEFE